MVEGAGRPVGRQARIEGFQVEERFRPGHSETWAPNTFAFSAKEIRAHHMHDRKAHLAATSAGLPFGPS